MLNSLSDIVCLLLENGFTTPSRIYHGLEIVKNNGVIKYRVREGVVEGFVVGDSGLVHYVVVSSDGYRCTCGDHYTSKYVCKHVIALLIKASRENRLDIEWLRDLRKMSIKYRRPVSIVSRY